MADRILTSKSALEGERKQVTVLFADLKGSMELLADRDPEEARGLLDPVLERMMEAVHRYEGTVNQVMGDGIMALFGAPLAHEDHAVRACYAALAMQSAIRSYSEQLRRSQGVEVQIRVGLNSGEVVVRAIGSDLRMDYTAVGQTTHLAARMEQLSSPGTTRLTSATLDLAEGFIKVTPLGPVPVKGLDQPVEVFELAGAGAARSRIEAAATRGLTRFIGRSTELAQMFSALERSHAGHGEVVALVGEPGVGKSRLVWEFLRSYRVHGGLVLEAGSVSYGKASAYRPVIDLLKTYFHIEDRDDVRRIREKATGKLLTLDRLLEPLLTPVLSLLDVPAEDAQWEELDPAQKRLRTLEALKRFTLRESQRQPLLLVFEDLHWIDPETQAFLDSVVESVPPARVLLLVNYRPEYQHRWGSKTYYTQLRIDPLSGESSQALLDAVLGDHSSLLPLKQLLIERTEGNPLFLEECVRTLMETGALQGSRGAYRLTAPATSIQMPATVQAILAARIDRLALANKRLLQAAAVIGKDVPYALLQAIADLPEEALRQCLEDLQAAEFLYETSLFPDLEYTFKHALTHEVAYGSVLQDRRRSLHNRIVEGIERLYPERFTEQVERLAYHAFRAEAWDKAVAYLRHSGEKAYSRSANREAIAAYEQALAALAHLPESGETLEQAIDLRLDLRNVLHSVGEFGQLFTCLDDAERLAQALGDQRRVAKVLGFRAFSSTLVGDHDRAIASAKRALAVAEGIGDLGVRVVATNYLGLACFYRGDYPSAIEFHQRNVDSLVGDLIRERFGLPVFPAVLARAYLAWSSAELGEFSAGIAPGEEGVKIAAALQQPFSQVWAEFSLGYLFLRKGDIDSATRILEQALDRLAQHHIPFVFPFVASLLGAARIESGRFSEAVSLLQQALEVATSMRNILFRVVLVGWLAEAHLLTGRSDDALELAGHALELARTHKERGWEAWTLRLLGKIASRGDFESVQQAEGTYRQAVVLAHELRMRPLEAQCLFALGELTKNAGELQAAQDQFSTALSMFQAMGMHFWVGKAESALKELSVQ